MRVLGIVSTVHTWTQQMLQGRNPCCSSQDNEGHIRKVNQVSDAYDQGYQWGCNYKIARRVARVSVMYMQLGGKILVYASTLVAWPELRLGVNCFTPVGS